MDKSCAIPNQNCCMINMTHVLRDMATSAATMRAV